MGRAKNQTVAGRPHCRMRRSQPPREPRGPEQRRSGCARRETKLWWAWGWQRTEGGQAGVHQSLCLQRCARVHDSEKARNVQGSGTRGYSKLVGCRPAKAARVGAQGHRARVATRRVPRRPRHGSLKITLSIKRLTCEQLATCPLWAARACHGGQTRNDEPHRNVQWRVRVRASCGPWGAKEGKREGEGERRHGLWRRGSKGLILSSKKEGCFFLRGEGRLGLRISAYFQHSLTAVSRRRETAKVMCRV